MYRVTPCVARLKTAEEAKALVSSSAALIGVFREPTSASAMFGTYAEVASDLKLYVGEAPVAAAYSAAYKDDPVAAAFGIKARALAPSRRSLINGHGVRWISADPLRGTYPRASISRRSRADLAATSPQSIPAILFFPAGATEPLSMPIPRKRNDFTEEKIAEFIAGALKK